MNRYNIRTTPEYRLISVHYGDRVAKRSQVPLINHIDEGLVILDAIGATEASKRAFCLHPLFQADDDLKENYYMASFIEPHVLLLTMEYRNIANAFLSDKMDDTIIGDIKLSPMAEVNEMLIADKVQNRKDFFTYHKATHARSVELDRYFDKWIDALQISAYLYSDLCDQIDMSKSNQKTSNRIT